MSPDVSGYKGWWPMQEFAGRTRNGVNVVKEVYRNVVTGEVHDPGPDGWNGDKPTNPTGVLPSYGFGGSEELWASAEEWKKKTTGRIIEQKGVKTVISYG